MVAFTVFGLALVVLAVLFPVVLYVLSDVEHVPAEETDHESTRRAAGHDRDD